MINLVGKASIVAGVQRVLDVCKEVFAGKSPVTFQRPQLVKLCPAFGQQVIVANRLFEMLFAECASPAYGSPSMT